MKKLDGYDDCIIGVIERYGHSDTQCYNKEKILDILKKRDGMSHAEALDFFDYNIACMWIGEDSPCFLTEN